MSPLLAVFAAAALGIDVGWQPIEGGGVEYIIQIEPDQVDRIVKFDDLISDVPTGLDIRRYRITVGAEKLPRRVLDSAATESEAAEVESQKARRPAETEQPTLDDAPPTKRVVAEGTIPASANEPIHAEAEPRDDSPVAEAEDAAEQGPEFPTTETTAKRPVSGSFEERDPEPLDEEEDYRAPARTTERPAAPARRDDLFNNADTLSTRSRLLDEPAAPVSRAPARDERYASEPVEDDYEAQKPPALASSPFRTAQNTSRESSNSFDRDRSEASGDWGPVVAIFFFLLMSMGANKWLGWIAWEARQRYQVLLEKYRAVGGKPSMDLV